MTLQRARLDLTQAGLARVLGVTVEALFAIEVRPD
jgi:DNA-binding XRE family transcriptional regulator